MWTQNDADASEWFAVSTESQAVTGGPCRTAPIHRLGYLCWLRRCRLSSLTTPLQTVPPCLWYSDLVDQSRPGPLSDSSPWWSSPSRWACGSSSERRQRGVIGGVRCADCSARRASVIPLHSHTSAPLTRTHCSSGLTEQCTRLFVHADEKCRVKWITMWFTNKQRQIIWAGEQRNHMVTPRYVRQIHQHKVETLKKNFLSLKWTKSRWNNILKNKDHALFAFKHNKL